MKVINVPEGLMAVCDNTCQACTKLQQIHCLSTTKANLAVISLELGLSGFAPEPNQIGNGNFFIIPCSKFPYPNSQN